MLPTPEDSQRTLFPVAIFGFNRPAEFQKVLERVIEASPPKIYVVLDGPRNEKEGSAQKEMKEIVGKIPDFIKVVTNFSEVNLGCKKRLSSGIDWVFEQEDAAIFLEDDCLPGADFFSFCSQLLQTYRDDERIGIISGYNPLLEYTQTKTESYYFSQYPHIWGWASWKRVWKNYDVDFKEDQIERLKIIKEKAHNKEEVRFWKFHFNNVANGQINTWDAQVTYMCFKKDYLNILPSGNLIQNIGFTENATHTTQSEGYQDHAIIPLNYPINHPTEFKPDFDNLRAEVEYQTPSILRRVLRKLLF